MDVYTGLFVVCMSLFWINMYTLGLAGGDEWSFGDLMPWTLASHVSGLLAYVAMLAVSPNSLIAEFSSLNTQDIGAIGVVVIVFFAWSLGGGFFVARVLNAGKKIWRVFPLPIAWAIFATLLYFA